MREYLSGPAMTVEVHDRDRKAEDVKLKASLFGDDLEDEKISNVGTVASECSLRKGAVSGGGGWVLLLLGVGEVGSFCCGELGWEYLVVVVPSFESWESMVLLVW